MIHTIKDCEKNYSDKNLYSGDYNLFMQVIQS